LTVHDETHLNDLVAIAERFGASIPVHLEVDTGMSRGGCALEDAPRLIARIAAHPRLKLAGLFTHFASSEKDVASADQQLSRFDALLEAHRNDIPPSSIIHAAS